MVRWWTVPWVKRSISVLILPAFMTTACLAKPVQGRSKKSHPEERRKVIAKIEEYTSQPRVKKALNKRGVTKRQLIRVIRDMDRAEFEKLKHRVQTIQSGKGRQVGGGIALGLLLAPIWLPLYFLYEWSLDGINKIGSWYQGYPNRINWENLAKNNDMKKARKYIKRGADVTGDQPVKEVIRANNLEMTRLLVQNGADTSGTLKTATKYADIELMKYLIQQGEEVDTYALNSAVYQSLAKTKFLVNRGASISATIDGMTTLDRAMRGGHEKIVKYLLERNAPMTYSMMDVVKHSSAKVLEVLLNRGYEVSGEHLKRAVAIEKLDMVKLFLEQEVDPNYKDENGYTSLHEASSSNNQEIAKLLVEHGAEINIRDEKSDTPLHWAIGSPKQYQVARYLIQKGGDVNADNDLGRTPLHIAAKDGKLKAVKLLMENGSEVNVKDKDGNTPLDIAIKNDHSAVINYLKGVRNHDDR